MMGLAGAAAADGMIFPNPVSTEQPFSVKYHRVKVEINGQSARTSVDQAFLNHSGRPLEGTYLFPLPEEARVSSFVMYEGDKPLTGELLTREETVKIYERIVSAKRDPGLLEYVGRSTIRARVFPVPANGEKRFQVEYSELLRMDGGVVKYVYPLSTERFSARPLEELTISVELRSSSPIKNIYCPSHEVSIKRFGDRRAAISFEASQVKPGTDFVLYYSVSPKDVGLTLLSYRGPSGEGYWMLLASPKAPDRQEVIPKDVVFVLDRTGSMSGEKIKQAKGALAFCLNSLDRADRFDVVAFNETPQTLGDRLMTAGAQNVKRALEFVDGFRASGGTNIDLALSTSLDLFNKTERPRYLVFLTDGLPTVGETNPETILAHARGKNEGRVRVFAFGVGFDVDVHFLDRLVEESSGISEYVRPQENIEAKVSAFYSKVSAPVMTDISLNASGSQVSEVFPRDYPDLFEGSQLIVVGRYGKPGPVTIELEGRMLGRERAFALRGRLAARDEEHDFVPMVWASRKIGYLLDEVRLHGQKKELVDEIIRLSKEFGIMTEFTAFLVTEPGVTAGAASERARASLGAAAKAQAGSWATGQAQNAQRLSRAPAPSAMAGGYGGYGGYGAYGAAGPAVPPVPAGLRSSNQAYLDAEGRVQTVQGVQNVGARTFYQQGRAWVDQAVNAKMPEVRIKQYSRAHFQLAAASKEARRYLALGDEVKLVLNGQAVVVGPEGKTELTDEELRKLAGPQPSVHGRATGPVTGSRPAVAAERSRSQGAWLFAGAFALAPVALKLKRRGQFAEK
jgi:Ca-activated chloride channel family protein